METTSDDPAIRRREQQKLASRRYRAKDRERVRRLERERRRRNPEAFAKRYRRWRLKHMHDPERIAKNRAAANKSYQPRTERQMLAIAGRPRPSTCEVCGRGGKICFDHDEATLLFRGFICNHCNLILGHAKDDPEILRKLAAYLEGGR